MPLSLHKVTWTPYLPISLSSWTANGVSERICEIGTVTALAFRQANVELHQSSESHLAVLASWYHWKTEVADLRREGLVQQNMFYVEIVLYEPRSSQIMQKLNPSRNANGSANPLGPFEHFTLPPLCKISRNISWESCRYIQLYNYPHDIVHCKYHTSKVTS